MFILGERNQSLSTRVSNLLVLINPLSETTRQMAVQLQSISTVVSTTSTGVLNGPNEPTSGDAGRGELDVHDATAPGDAVAHRGLEPSIETDLKRARYRAFSDNSSMRVTTSVTTQRCPPRCPCQCHTRSHIRSSPWFKAIIGQMLFSYHSVIRTTPCDYQPCRENPQKTPQKTEFTYYFPHWLTSRALIASCTSGITGPGASISIAMPVVLPDHEPIWEAVCNGNIPFLQQLFRQGYTPYVVDEDGGSLVKVRIIPLLNNISLLLRVCSVQFASHVILETMWYISIGISPGAITPTHFIIYRNSLTSYALACRHV